MFPIAGLAESPQFKNMVANSVTGDILAEQNEWIYLKDKMTDKWKKLIPGVCPQWHPDGKRFFYFLDVGYDGPRAELWLSDANGEGRIRLTRSDYFVQESPVVSKDARKLAYHYWTCRASGDFRDIVVIELNGKGFDDTVEARVVFRTKGSVHMGPLRWVGEKNLEVTVNGEKKEIDTSGNGERQLP